MSERIKTALERALERAAQMHINDADLLRMERMDTGRVLAARYLRNPAVELRKEIGALPPDARKDALDGLEEVLLRSISLPSDEYSQQLSQRALEALTIIKGDVQAVEAVTGQIGYLFSYYVQAYRQTYNSVKERLQQRVAATQQTLEHQTGMRMRLDAEQLPEFRVELTQALAGLNAQYEALLNEHKEKLRCITTIG